MLALILAMLLFTCMDLFAKSLMQTYPVGQIVWARYTSQTLLMVAIFAPSLLRRLRTKHLKIQLLRSILLLGATSSFFTALTFMPIAEVVAVFEVAPLLITILGAVVLREAVGPRRWAAVLIGLVGALVIIRPGMDVFQPAALLALLAASCMACYQIATRYLGSGDPIWTTMLYASGIGAILSTLALPFFWQTPALADVPLMLSFGWIGFVGHLILIYALGQAPASTLAPFNYVGFVWALALGYLVFGELPDAVTFIGAAIIVCSGLYVWHRERVRRVKHTAAAPTVARR